MWKPAGVCAKRLLLLRSWTLLTLLAMASIVYDQAVPHLLHLTTLSQATRRQQPLSWGTLPLLVATSCLEGTQVFSEPSFLFKGFNHTLPHRKWKVLIPDPPKH